MLTEQLLVPGFTNLAFMEEQLKAVRSNVCNKPCKDKANMGKRGETNVGLFVLLTKQTFVRKRITITTP